MTKWQSQYKINVNGTCFAWFAHAAALVVTVQLTNVSIGTLRSQNRVSLGEHIDRSGGSGGYNREGVRVTLIVRKCWRVLAQFPSMLEHNARATKDHYSACWINRVNSENSKKGNGKSCQPPAKHVILA